MPRTGLEIPEDPDFERAEWRVERLGFGVIFAVVLAATLGFFGGGGPFASAVRGDRDGPLWVEHDRFQRYGASTRLRVHADPTLIRDGVLPIAVDRSYLAGTELTGVTPEPSRIEVGDEAIVFSFVTREAAGRVLVQFDLQPHRRGVQRGRVSVDTLTVEFRAFVYP